MDNNELFAKLRSFTEQDPALKTATDKARHHTRVLGLTEKETKADDAREKPALEVCYSSAMINMLNNSENSKVCLAFGCHPFDPTGIFNRDEQSVHAELLRCSNLMLCLAQKKIHDDFFSQNINVGHYFSDKLVYLKDLTVFSPMNKQILLDKALRRNFDAAAYVPPLLGVDGHVEDILLLKIYRSRFRCLFAAAAINGADVLIIDICDWIAHNNPYELLVKAIRETVVSDVMCPKKVIFSFGGLSEQSKAAYDYFAEHLGEGDGTSENRIPVQNRLPAIVGTDYKGKNFSVFGDSISTFDGAVAENCRSYYGFIHLNEEDYDCFCTSCGHKLTGKNITERIPGVGEMGLDKYVCPECSKETVRIASVPEYGKNTVADMTGVKSPEDTWWGQVASHFGGEIVVNNSTVGALVCSEPNDKSSFLHKDRYEKLHVKGSLPDVILVFAGLGDLLKKTEPERFAEAYGKMLDGLAYYYPASRVVCLTLPSVCSENGEIPPEYANAEAYNSAVRKAALDKKMYVADIASAGIKCSSSDGVHPDEKGMKLIAENVIRAMTDCNYIGNLVTYSDIMFSEKTKLFVFGDQK